MHLLHLTYHTAQLSAVVLRSVSCLLIIMLGGWLAATVPTVAGSFCLAPA